MRVGWAQGRLEENGLFLWSSCGSFISRNSGLRWILKTWERFTFRYKLLWSSLIRGSSWPTVGVLERLVRG